MKRSEINRAVKRASEAFEKHGWILPPNPKWDVTDFGLGDFEKYGLICINLTEQPEYCEKIMFLNKSRLYLLIITLLRKKILSADGENLLLSWKAMRISSVYR